MVLSYDDVKYEFEKNNCKLLMTEDEFKQKPRRTTNEKYEYIASCESRESFALPLLLKFPPIRPRRLGIHYRVV